jgi:glycine cleavage system aminomethyltransferase T
MTEQQSPPTATSTGTTPAPAASRQPFQSSALYRRHLALGATMVDFHAWRVAAHFTSAESEAQRVRERAGLSDVSWLGKLDVRGSLAEQLATQAEATLAGQPSVGTAGTVPRRAWRLAHQHVLVTCGPDEQERLTEQLAGTSQTAGGETAGACAHVTDVTSVYAALLLAGPRSAEILPKLTSLDVSSAAFPNLSVAQSGLAEVHTIVLRADLPAVPAHWLLVAREYGEYVWGAVLRAGREAGIVPFGLTALQTLATGER